MDKDIGIPKPDKKPILGRYVYLLSAMAAIGGFLFGYDTGIVSSAFIYVPRSPELRPVTHVWVEVMVGITAGELLRFSNVHPCIDPDRNRD